ncbi:hypothetical protein BSLG_002659 [Batrachochytrium salamandrivorans]|nr:hypothetical protein BSLG_002659 [Batrachochytrium salamandrivorans]
MDKLFSCEVDVSSEVDAQPTSGRVVGREAVGSQRPPRVMFQAEMKHPVSVPAFTLRASTSDVLPPKVQMEDAVYVSGSVLKSNGSDTEAGNDIKGEEVSVVAKAP